MNFTYRVEALTERTVTLIYEFENGEVRSVQSAAPTSDLPLEALIEKYKPNIFWDCPEMQPAWGNTTAGAVPINLEDTIKVTTL